MNLFIDLFQHIFIHKYFVIFKTSLFGIGLIFIFPPIVLSSIEVTLQFLPFPFLNLKLQAKAILCLFNSMLFSLKIKFNYFLTIESPFLTKMLYSTMPIVHL